MSDLETCTDGAVKTLVKAIKDDRNSAFWGAFWLGGTVCTFLDAAPVVAAVFALILYVLRFISRRLIRELSQALRKVSADAFDKSATLIGVSHLGKGNWVKKEKARIESRGVEA